MTLTEASADIHGTEAGYRAGCRLDCCSTAHTEKMRRDRKAVKDKRDRDRAEIEALRSGTTIDLRPASADPAIGELRVLPLEVLRPADDNLRRDLGDLTELAESIAAVGVLQALLHTLTDQVGIRLLAVACELLRLEVADRGWGAEYRAALENRRTRPWPAVAMALTLAAGEWQVRAQQGWDSRAVASLYRRLRADGYEPCADERALLKASR